METLKLTDKVDKSLLTKDNSLTLTKVKTYLRENKTLSISLSISLIISVISAITIYFTIFTNNEKPKQILDLNEKYIESQKTIVSNIVAINEKITIPKTEVNPLNGVLYTKSEMSKMLDRRPVAVMINNHVAARPQTGLNEADIVYEALAESGITRYMAIYWSNGAKVAGPIRSARQYYLEWLSPFDALYIHDGCAASDDPRTNACGNIYTYNIKDVSTRGSWRSTDRVAPHNEYNSILSAWDYGKSNKWDEFPSKTESLKFKRDASFDNRGNKTKVSIAYRLDINNGGLYDTEWVYDKNTNLYTHRVAGVTDIDHDTKKTITAKNVIIEELKLQDAFDGKARVIITTIGEGSAKFLIDGKIINGKWKKSSRTDRTTYYDSTGKEIEFNRGKIWVNAVPKEKGKVVILEQ